MIVTIILVVAAYSVGWLMGYGDAVQSVVRAIDFANEG